MRVLVLNPGSATLKATVLDLPGRDPRFDRTIDWPTDASGDDREATIGRVVDELAADGIAPESIESVGYRVVHGGSRFVRPTLLDDATARAIEDLSDLAPLHNPLAAATIRAGRRVLPGAPHIAAFDTAFHASLPESVRRYPVPERWERDFGVRRYGFHGLSVEWATRRAAELLGRPSAELGLVVAHLGGGCSVTAVEGGRSVDTSMGLTPLEGLMMATRSGSIDPGVIVRVIRHGLSADEVEADLDRHSGLLGVSRRTADMRELLEAESGGDERAALALEMFVRRAAAGIAASATALSSVDAIVFTGGIGEHAADVRRRICSRLWVLRLPVVQGDLDGDAILTGRDVPAVLAIGAREDIVIAEAAAFVLGR